MKKAKQRYEEELENKNEIIAELSTEVLALKKLNGCGAEQRM